MLNCLKGVGKFKQNIKFVKENLEIFKDISL